MSFLFWLALIVGGGLLFLSMAGDIFGIEGHGADALHSDIGTHGDTEWGRIFSLRNATYFLFAFGAVGVLLNLIFGGRMELLSFAVAGLTGVAAWTLSMTTFRYLKRTESGVRLDDHVLIGRVGEVTLPIPKEGTGKIQITSGGHTQELLAMPLEAEDAQDPESWRSVLVIEVQDGVALVAPYTEASEDEPQ